MITPSEMETLIEDIHQVHEDAMRLNIRYFQGVPDQMFNHKITARLRELLEVAQNIERNSYNRDISVGLR